MSSGRKITLKSSDGETFEIDEAVALESQIIKHVIEDVCVDDGIPLPNVTSKILSKVIDYWKKHVEAPKFDDRASSADDDLKAWDADFVNVDQATLFGLILAANYLDIRSLLDLTCQTVADMIKGKTTEEIRQTFNIQNDFTPEEEEEFRRENQWVSEEEEEEEVRRENQWDSEEEEEEEVRRENQWDSEEEEEEEFRRESQWAFE